MFGRFYRKHWHRKTRRSSRGRHSALGGEIKSMAEIEAFSKKIAAHEKREAQVADEVLDDEWAALEKNTKK